MFNIQEIEKMEDNNDLQDAILSFHHICTHTLQATPAYKIIENQEGVVFIRQAQVIAKPINI